MAKDSENSAARRTVRKNDGHRQRLRERFLRTGINGLDDYEAIELLLTYAIPRRDVKPYAKSLLEHFGSVEALLDAGGAELVDNFGLGSSSATLILLVKSLCVKYLEQRIRRVDVLKTPGEVINFLRMKLGGGKKETLAVLFLNSRNHLIACETYPGTVDRATVYTREVAELALLCHATGVIVAHNHPSGLCEPSPNDIDLTHKLKMALSTVNIPLYDHFIVTPAAYISVMKR